MSSAISPDSSNGLDSILKSFETADNKTIRIALEAIRRASSSPSPIPISEDAPSNPLIRNLFAAIHGCQGSSPLWIQELGYETVQEWVESRLEHCLWNHIEVSSSLDPTYDGLASLILAKPTLKKIPAINIPSDKAVDRFRDSLLQENLIAEGEISLEGEFTYFCERAQERFDYLIEQTKDERRKQELSYMEGEFHKLKNRIETHPKAELFSENEEERKEQYYTFGLRLGIAFVGLLDQKNEDLLFERISEFLDTCFKGWDEHTLQLMAMGGNDSIYLNPLIEAHKAGCTVRRRMAQKALAETFPRFENDVHYQSAAKWAMNNAFHLGFSKEELGTLEPDMVDLVAPMMRQKTTELLDSKGKEELIAELISRYKAITSEEEKKGVFAEVLAQYLEKVKEDPSFLIDPLKEVELAFEQFQASAAAEALKNLKTALQEKGITSASTKLLYEKKLEEIVQIMEKNPDFFVNIRALYNRDLLERKLNEEEQFGAYAWAIHAKVLCLDNSPKEDLNVRILQWIGTLAFSENEQDRLFEALSRFIKQLEEGERKNALQTCLATRDLKALIALQSKPETFSSLEEILYFGTSKDLKVWKQKRGMDETRLINDLILLLKRGDVEILQEFFIGNEEILEQNRGQAVAFPASKGHLEMVQWLLSTGEISDDDRGQAVVAAAPEGHLEMVQWLLSTGQISYDDRGLAVAEAVKWGHLNVVEELLKNGANIDERIRTDGILFAIDKGNLKLVTALLEGAVISQGARAEAFLKAIEKGHLDMVKYLLSGSTNQEFSEGDRGFTVIEAAKWGHLEIARWFLNTGKISENDRGAAVVLAARKGNLELVRALLEGAVISKEARAEAVFEAIEKNHLGVVKYLLRGSTISEDDRGSIIGLLAREGHLEGLKLLLEGAVISEKLRGDACVFATEKGHLEVVEALLSGSQPISETDRGRAVRSAADHGYLDLVKLLLAGAVISEEDRGQAVILAADQGYLDLVKELLKNGTISQDDKLYAKTIVEKARSDRGELILDRGRNRKLIIDAIEGSA